MLEAHIQTFEHENNQNFFSLVYELLLLRSSYKYPYTTDEINIYYENIVKYDPFKFVSIVLCIDYCIDYTSVGSCLRYSYTFFFISSPVVH